MFRNILYLGIALIFQAKLAVVFWWLQAVQSL